MHLDQYNFLWKYQERNVTWVLYSFGNAFYFCPMIECTVLIFYSRLWCKKQLTIRPFFSWVFLLEFNSLTVVTDQYIAVEIQQKLTIFLIFAQITSNDILWHESCNPCCYVGRKNRFWQKACQYYMFTNCTIISEMKTTQKCK